MCMRNSNIESQYDPTPVSYKKLVGGWDCPSLCGIHIHNPLLRLNNKYFSLFKYKLIN